MIKYAHKSYQLLLIIIIMKFNKVKNNKIGNLAYFF